MSLTIVGYFHGAQQLKCFFIKNWIKENFPINVFGFLLWACAIILFFNSCTNQQEFQEENIIQYKSDGFYCNHETGIELHNNIEFEYNDHDYILFVLSNGNACVVHNPDCHCYNRKKD